MLTPATRPLLRGSIIAATLGALSALGFQAQRPQAQAAAPAGTGVTAADYDRAAGLRARFEGQVLDVAEAPTWLPSGRFWYRKSVPGGHAFVLVDPATASKQPAFDHARLASALNRASGKAYTATTLPFSTMTLGASESRVSFAGEGNTNWACTLTDYTCSRDADPPSTAAGTPGGRGAGAGQGGAGGRGGRGQLAGGVARSPDGHTIAFIRDHNIHVRGAADAPDAGVALTTGGTAEHPFTPNTIVWSPDSRKIAASRVTVKGDRRAVRFVESSPADQVQPKTFERTYAKPGDALDRQEWMLLDVPGRRAITIDTTLFPTPYSVSQLAWRQDSRAFTFEYNQRGHQLYRVLEVNAASGVARTLVEEQSKAFVDYRRANGTLTDSGRTYRLDLADGAETIWMSERDGWAHLYLYDGATGRVKNQITKGAWLVRSVLRVDDAARQIWFTAAGMTPGQDPYFAHYYRIDFDGTNLTPLTEADGNHTVSFSPDHRYYVDTWSRVDLAPVAQLRRTSDRRVILDLERGNLAPLAAVGWRAPEAFTAKGRDHATDIWGVIIRPTGFDPARKYPVIENIYAGPQGSFVPKTFNSYYGMQALAELGFIVVQIDGMGTANRSKAFHDVAWKDLGDAGFPDRILWHQAVARRYPWYDITRVGIYGGSAGGQNSLGGMLFHPQFYKAAVSFAGCHDNRMDKMWWNEQWMGYPLGPEYAASSNVVHAGKLQGHLLLVVGELDTNVDPSSTMQVVNALIKANKQFDLLVIPGEDHSAGRRGASAAYGDRKLWDFFVRHLHNAPTPAWNAVAAPPAAAGRPSTQGDVGLWGVSWAEVEAGWNEGSR